MNTPNQIAKEKQAKEFPKEVKAAFRAKCKEAKMTGVDPTSLATNPVEYQIALKVKFAN